MKMYPMIEQDGCRLYGSDSYDRAYFDTEMGKINFLEVCSYYDLPLLCFFEHENGQKYFGSVDGRIFNRDEREREWAYILVSITDETHAALQTNKMKINVPFDSAKTGYRIVCQNENKLDHIETIDPTDYEQYEHELGDCYLTLDE